MNRIVTNVVSKAASRFFIAIPLLGNAVSSGGTGYASVASDLSPEVALNIGDPATNSATGH